MQIRAVLKDYYFRRDKSIAQRHSGDGSNVGKENHRLRKAERHRVKTALHLIRA